MVKYSTKNFLVIVLTKKKLWYLRILRNKMVKISTMFFLVSFPENSKYRRFTSNYDDLQKFLLLLKIYGFILNHFFLVQSNTRKFIVINLTKIFYGLILNQKIFLVIIKTIFLN